MVIPSYINLTSDVGDYIGGGRQYRYSKADALITVTTNGGLLTVRVDGDESWSGDFRLPDTYTQLRPGTYVGLQRYPFHDSTIGGLSWQGEGRGCNVLTGSIIIDSVSYNQAELTSIDLRFEQHCEGAAPALRGEIHWDAADTTSPPGPVVPPPTGLWEPAVGATPDAGNYVYLESEAGDYVGAGGNFLYTEADSVVTVSAPQGGMSISIAGNESWGGDFKGMHALGRLEVGYYGDLGRYPFHNPVKGGLNWFGEGRGCNTVSGWFVVDRVAYDGETLAAIDLRFEQRCEGSVASLHGEIHWDAEDTTVPPGPVVPPPGLWEPAPGVTPASGNYVYFESQPGDYVGSGGTYLYTQANSQIITSAGGAVLLMSVRGDELWRGSLQGMSSLSRFEVGYYGDLERYPFHNPAKGGLSWIGRARGCNSLSGWFVVDSVTYDGDTLIAIDFRFEQHCEGQAPALHGAIHWDAADTTRPPGPVVPPPPGLWDAAPGTTPATGNYVYLESQPGDYVGAGGTYLYTQVDSLLTTSLTEAGVNVAVTGDERWAGAFARMYSLSRMEVGYYGDLRSPANPAKGALSWGGEGRVCSTTGWFVVDSVTYVGETLTAFDVRFEQHCGGAEPALHGKIHWDASDTTSPPGPVMPPPGSLWEPAPGATPATGNYVYLESQPGDYIGAGGTYLYTPATAQIVPNLTGAEFSISVNGNESWGGFFQGMNTLSRLEPGYYGGLLRHPFHNPTKGGLEWGGQGRGCNTLTGWFVVDNVSYVGETLTAIDLRFEQHCEGLTPALHGEIHWSQ